MIERYYRELLNFLTRAVRDRDVAADLAQESYARLLAAHPAGRAIRNPRALLYRTARNLVVDRHRRARVRGEADLGPAGASAGTTHDEGSASPHDEPARLPADGALVSLPGPRSLEPDVILASRQHLASVIETIEGLPPRCREAFVLFRFDGLTYAEIARRMGISVRTVEMQLRIAMQACWRSLDTPPPRTPTPPTLHPAREPGHVNPAAADADPTDPSPIRPATSDLPPP